MKKNILLMLTVSYIACSLYASETKNHKLDSVLVTVNKIEETLQNIPQNITVLDKETINDRDIDTIDKIMVEIPNMTSSNISGMGTFANYRGINTSVFNPFSSPVVIYINGVPTSNRFLYKASLVNAKKIEVLRGPQGTLYGKDSIGSIINIITEDTPDHLGGEISLDYGTNKYKETTFNISAPLLDNKLYGGINGYYQEDNGNLTNTYVNDDKAAKSKSHNINAYLNYLATDNLSVKFATSQYSDKDYGTDSATYTHSLTSLSESKYDDTKSASYDMPSVEDKDVNSYSLSLEYLFNDFDFNWVSTYKKIDFNGVYDFDFSSNNSNDGTTQYNYFDTKSYTNEFRLSDNNDYLTWIAGLYFDDEKYTEETGYDNYSFYGKYNASGPINSSTQALFGQLMFPISEKSDLTLGGRYQKIKKDANIDVSIQNFPNSNYNFNVKKDWNSFLPKIALNYKNNDFITTYSSIAKGYMPGGFNTFPSSSNVDNNSYDEQTSMNYELGIKGSLKDFIFNTSIFYMDIKDLQVYRVNSTTGAWYTNNAKKAHTYGIEMEGRYFFTDYLDLEANLGFIQAKYDEYNTGSSSLNGKDIENTPSHTMNLTLTYNGNTGIYAVGNVYNRGNISFYDTSTQKFLEDGPGTTASIRLGKKTTDWDIYAYVNNITDEHYVTNYFSKGTLASVSYNEGRFIGVGIKYKF